LEVKSELVMTRPFRVVVPVTVKFPPKVVAPVPTVRVLLPAMERFPEKVEAPVTERAPVTL